MRRTEVDAARLTERLRAAGDTRSLTSVSQALATLRSQMASGVNSALSLRQAMSGFADVTNGAKVALV